MKKMMDTVFAVMMISYGLLLALAYPYDFIQYDVLGLWNYNEVVVATIIEVVILGILQVVVFEMWRRNYKRV